MTIESFVQERGITEILHFTTTKGCLGVLSTKALKARARLSDDKMLEYILQINTNNDQRNRDSEWHDYVNLSITEINKSFWNYSERIHNDEDLWWCILAFSSEILSHEGVFFATTNNTYSGVIRHDGIEGLRELFQPRIHCWLDNYEERNDSHRLNMTTCNQAEVLYPGQISTEFLRTIYVKEEACADTVAGQLSICNHPNVRIAICPEKFEV